MASLYALGDILFNGAKGVAVDIPRAMEFFERGHAAGSIDSSYMLGWIYEGGHGVPADSARALGYYRAAFEGGSPEATQVMGVLYQEGGLLPVDLVYARHLLMQAVQMDVQRAFNELGIMMIDGRGGPVDWPRAEALFRGGYRRGSPVAAINLARLLNNTEYQGYDPVEAFSYCLWAMAEAGDDAPVDYRQACAAVAEALSPGELATAQTLADGL